MLFFVRIFGGSRHPRRLIYPVLRYYAECDSHNMVAFRYLCLRLCYNFFPGWLRGPLTEVSTNVNKCLLFWGKDQNISILLNIQA